MVSSLNFEVLVNCPIKEHISSETEDRRSSTTSSGTAGIAATDTTVGSDCQASIYKRGIGKVRKLKSSIS